MFKYTFLTLFLFINPLFANAFTVQSSAFDNETTIPTTFTCHGKNISPPLHWSKAPAGTQSFVLIMEDPDGVKGHWVHWLLFNIPAHLNQFSTAMPLPKEALSGNNSWNKKGYSGPCPPTGTHRYFFKLYALDTRLTVNSSVSKNDILNAMTGHVLATTALIGVYSAPK